MTVAELIEKLQKFDPELGVVLLCDKDEGWEFVTEPILVVAPEHQSPNKDPFFYPLPGDRYVLL